MICIVSLTAAHIPNLHRHPSSCLLNPNPPRRTLPRRRRRRRPSPAMDSVIIRAPPPPVLLTSGASGRVNALLSLHALKSLLQVLQRVLFIILLPFRRRRSSAAAGPGDGAAGAGDGGRKEGGGAGKVVVRVPAGMVPRRPRDGEVAARRAMAIKRLRAEEDGEGRSAREFAVFATARGDVLFTQSWTPLSVPTRGLIVLMHGLNEHSGRYNHFAKLLNENGFKVYAMDWIGHGGSDGLHGYVHSLDYAVSDLKAFLEKVRAENPGFPCFCFGHSTGAAIVLKAVLDPKVEAQIEGVVLTSPALRVQPTHAIVTVLAPIISLLIPTYQFNTANKKGPPVSRDPEALRAKYSDPLVFTGSIRVRTGYEILRITSYLQQNMHKVNTPFLVMHGTSDTVTDPDASQRLYDEAPSKDKSIKLYEGFLHDLLFEPERDEIAKDIVDWFTSKLDALNRSWEKKC